MLPGTALRFGKVKGEVSNRLRRFLCPSLAKQTRDLARASAQLMRKCCIPKGSRPTAVYQLTASPGC